MSATRQSDVLIVGAGPAGATLALRLARRGWRVALFDRARFPREKVCGEGLMPHGLAALDELGLGEAARVGGRSFDGIRYALPGGLGAEACFPDGASGLAIRRKVLDEAIIRACEAEPNLSLRLGVSVRDILPGRGASALVAGGEAWRAPLLVGADGARSRVRAALGLERGFPRRRRFAVRGHAEHPARADEDRKVEVFLHPEFELYMTPVEAGLTGIILTVSEDHLSRIQGDPEAGLRAALRRTGAPQLLRLAEAPFRSRVQAQGPLAIQARRPHADGALLVGDAAGALDPITGEGMSLALKTARFAAEVIDDGLRAGDVSARRLATYTRRRRRAMRELALLTRIVLLLTSSSPLARHVVANLARSPETFSKLLGITAGTHSLTSLSLRDHLRLAIGA